MEFREAVHAILLMFLLCMSSMETARCMKRGDVLFVKCCSQQTEDQLAWMDCRKELVDNKDCFEGLVFDFLEDQSTTLDLTYIQEVIGVMSSQHKQAFLDCLNKINLPYDYSAEADNPTELFIHCFELHLQWCSIPEKYLNDGSHQDLDPSLVSKPSTTIPVDDDPAPTRYPLMNPLPSPIYRKKLSEHKKHKSNTQKKSKSQGSDGLLLVAIIATAIATFFVAAAVFSCWLCFKDNDNIEPKDKQRDDRPLLHLSSFSASSSQNSSSFGNYKEFGSNGRKSLSFKSTTSAKSGFHGGSLVDQPASRPKEEPIPPLKLPPGRVPPPQPKEPPAAPGPPAPRPPPPPAVAAPPPAPVPKGGRAPPAPPPKGKLRPAARRKDSTDGANSEDDKEGSNKAKLKPFFWDKVMASPDHSMVWHEISSGSFQFNEEMIESLFSYNAANNAKSDSKKDQSESQIRYIQIIDNRKAQNLSILLRALNVTTDEVLDALREGTELPTELLQTLTKMAPTADEELKLRLFAGELSQLGPAERFLKKLVEIPFAFKRMEMLIFMSSFQEELSALKDSLTTLEVASDKIRNSRLFLKLLEAVLKTGNRMNDGTYRGRAQAFKLDTLLKLSDVKGTDGKTTLLHFVVQEIIRSEGIRAARCARTSQSDCSIKSVDSSDDFDQDAIEDYRNLGLKVISGLSTELEDVTKAAAIDADVMSSTLSKQKVSLTKAKKFLSSDDLKNMDGDCKFYRALASFVDNVESDIAFISEEEKRIMSLVQSAADYFHGNATKNEGLRLFAIVRDFLIMLDKACKDVTTARAARPKPTNKKETTSLDSSDSSSSLDNRQNSENGRRQLFPAIAERRIDYSSSDDESSSP